MCSRWKIPIPFLFIALTRRSNKRSLWSVYITPEMISRVPWIGIYCVFDGEEINTHPTQLVRVFVLNVCHSVIAYGTANDFAVDWTHHPNKVFDTLPILANDRFHFQGCHGSFYNFLHLLEMLYYGVKTRYQLHLSTGVAYSRYHSPYSPTWTDQHFHIRVRSLKWDVQSKQSFSSNRYRTDSSHNVSGLSNQRFLLDECRFSE